MRGLLGKDVDDVVLVPMQSTELTARIANLTRLRTCRRKQLARYQESETLRRGP